MFTPKVPHFFKVILEDTIRDGKLEIPKKFVRKYGNGMLSSVVLEVPSGAVWRVGLTRSDGRVWLQCGWNEFAEYYSLKYGHFLVFRYEGNCNFHVLIFDTSASEIEYPNFSSRHGRGCILYKEFQEPEIGEAEDDVSVEILHEIPPRRKVRQKSPAPCSRPCKKMKTTMSDSLIDDQTGFLSCQKNYVAKEPTVEESESDSSVQILDDFSSFHRTQEASSLWCPKPSNKVRNKNSHGNRESTSKIPPLTQHCKKKGIQCTRMKLEKSIKNEYLDNSMKEFGGSLNVPAKSCSTLRRTTKKGEEVKMSSLMRSLSCKEKENFLLRDTIVKSGNPVFPIVMRPAYVNGGILNLPFQFAKRYLGERHDKIILCLPNRRTWSVKYAFRTKSSFQPKPRFYYSWREFVLDNNLKVGDVCVFELIKDAGTSFNVIILSAANGEYYSLSSLANASGASQVKSWKFLVPEIESDRTNDYLAGNSNLDDQSKGQHFQPTRGKHKVGHSRLEQSGVDKSAGRKVTLQSPCLLPSHTADTTRKSFKVVLKSYNFERSKVTMQFQFVQKFITQKTEDWVLQVVDRTWPVKLTSYPQHNLANLSRLSSFARDNSLKIGDTCVFEIAEESSATIKVSIIRCSGTSKLAGNSNLDNQSMDRHFLRPRRKCKVPSGLKQSGVEKSAWALVTPQSPCQKSLHTVDPTRKFIEVVLRSYHFKKLCLDFSFHFVKKFVSQKAENWVLQVLDRTWPVKLISYPHHHSATLSSGWSSFAKDNSLKIGDTCVLEIAEETSATIKVSFVRCSG
ncbi:hypothetical protein SLE2022_302670 [Rubroshorea leprosula]